MSWGDSFINGFQTGADIRDKKKRRQFEKDQTAAAAALQLEVQARNIAAEKERQNTDISFRGGEGDKDRMFRTSERVGGQEFAGTQADKDRTFRTGEREGGQNFQGAQAELERGARAGALDKELAQRALLAGAEQMFKEKQFGWQKDPTNPTNAYYGALTKSMAVPDFDAGGGPRMSPEDQQAMDWARANPNDPRSAAILKKLTGK